MSALIAAHIPDEKQTTLILPVSELRKNDVIIDGIGIDEPVTVNRIFGTDDVRMLTLIDSQNGIHYREYSVEKEITIQN